MVCVYLLQAGASKGTLQSPTCSQDLDGGLLDLPAVLSDTPTAISIINTLKNMRSFTVTQMGIPCGTVFTISTPVASDVNLVCNAGTSGLTNAYSVSELCCAPPPPSRRRPPVVQQPLLPVTVLVQPPAPQNVSCDLLNPSLNSIVAIVGGTDMGMLWDGTL